MTVVVATRNRAELLPECIATVLRQRTDARFELLVVDNGSHDATGEIVAGWTRRDPRVRLVAEPTIGLSRAKNAGIRAARGDLLLFTDDDVVLADGWIAAYVEFFREARARPTLAGGPVLAIAQDLSPWPAWISASGRAELPRLYHGDSSRLLGRYDWLWGANMAAHKQLFADIGTFDESVGVSGERRGTFEDVEIVQRVAAHGGENWYLPTAVVHHRTPIDAARPRVVAEKAFTRGANDVLRERRGAYYDRAAPVPRAPIAGALVTPAPLAAWMLAAAAYRMTRSPRAFDLARRSAWAAGWCIATASGRRRRSSPGRWRRLAWLARALALRLTPP